MERPQYANVLITPTSSMRKRPDTPAPPMPNSLRHPNIRTLLEPVYVKDSFQVVNFMLEDHCSEATDSISDGRKGIVAGPLAVFPLKMFKSAHVGIFNHDPLASENVGAPVRH